jgi:hypothetical protein
VVPKRNTDARPPVQGVRHAEGIAEDDLGRGQKENWEMEERLEGPGPAGGREMQQTGTGLLSTTDVGRRVPTAAVEDEESEASEWELREKREGKRR